MFKLLVETPAPKEQFEYILEEKNSNSPSTLYIKGPYIMVDETNRNKRYYPAEEMRKEVGRYIKEMIETKRSMGELNHPTSVEVNPERACHMVVDLKNEGKFYYGKSKVLSTPMGMIVRSLVQDGVTMGMSTRALGQLCEESNGVNRVTDVKLIAVDCVADPSCPKAFVNGILESKQWVLNSKGELEESYDQFQKAISKLPKHNKEKYLLEQITDFINKISAKI